MVEDAELMKGSSWTSAFGEKTGIMEEEFTQKAQGERGKRRKKADARMMPAANAAAITPVFRILRLYARIF